MMDTSARTQQQPPKPRRLIDNVAEVRRRKEAAERLIRERHEALRRQHEEKIMKINEERQRQQRELKERHAKELKRQQDVLQRRMALMERDNARKKEILEKNHAAVSRLANNSSRKNYAFGSSTPRELTFLEGHQMKSIVQEKRVSPEKQNSNGSVNTPPRRSVPSVMSTSMYVHSTPDRSRHALSVTRLSQPKNTPTKQQNLMTQSVYSQSNNLGMTPVSRSQRRKPMNHLTASAPNTPLASAIQSEKQKKQQTKSKPRGLPTTPTRNKQQSTTTKLSKSVSELARKESLHSNDTHSSTGARTTESPIDVSSISDEVPQEMPELETYNEVQMVEVEQKHEYVIHQNGDVPQNHSEREEMPSIGEAVSTDNIHTTEPQEVYQPIPTDDVHTTEVYEPEQASEEESMQKPVHEEKGDDGSPAVAQLVTISEAVDVKGVTQEIPHEEMLPASSVEQGGASLADELAGIFDTPLPPPPVTEAVEEVTEAVPPPEPVKTAEFGLKEEPAVEVLKEESAAEAPKVETAVEAPEGEVAAEMPRENHAEESHPENKAAEEAAKPEVVHAANVAPEERPAEETPHDASGESQEKSESGSVLENGATEEAAEHPPVVTEEPSAVPSHKEVTDGPLKTADNDSVKEAQVNGIEKQPPPVIAELPGTVPAAKETDDSVVKKIPSPPNEFIAHRLRREQEQRELDERKARIAAILAKSRNLSNSTTPLVAGRTSPPRSESAQDVLKRLASNGNLPALQKLVARHASETATIEQFSAPEDPAPQAI